MLSHRYTEIKPKFFFNDVVSAKGTGIYYQTAKEQVPCVPKNHTP